MKLKKYNEYLKRIETYAKVSNVKIIWVADHEGCGEYDPNTRSVIVDGTQGESEIIATLLHEFGHFMDDQRNPNKYGSGHHWYGRTRLENDMSALTSNQKAIVWDTELEARKNAEALARQLKIPLGKWYKKDKDSALNTYRSIRVE